MLHNDKIRFKDNLNNALDEAWECFMIGFPVDTMDKVVAIEDKRDQLQDNLTRSFYDIIWDEIIKYDVARHEAQEQEWKNKNNEKVIEKNDPLPF